MNLGTMKRLLALVGWTLAAVVPSAVAVEGTNPWRFEELSRRPAVEARQGVAATSDALYAIGNHELG